MSETRTWVIDESDPYNYVAVELTTAGQDDYGTARLRVCQDGDTSTILILTERSIAALFDALEAIDQHIRHINHIKGRG